MSVHCTKFVLFIYNPNKNSTDSIALLIPLLSHMLSSKTEAFIVPWNKLFCSLLTEVHNSLVSLRVWSTRFSVSSAKGGKFRRQSRAVCATFQNLCSYEIIRHLNLYTQTHNRTFIGEQNAHRCHNIFVPSPTFPATLLIFSSRTFSSSS